MQFSWEEKIVAPLIAAPNGECATKKTKRKGKNGSVTTLAMRVTLTSNAKRNTLFFFVDKLDEVLIRVTLDVEMSLREKKNRNGENNLGSCLFSYLKLPIGRQLHM
jgi:hypothetical protein